MHLVAASPSLKFPGSHRVHALAPLALPYSPLGHTLHAAASVAARLAFPYFPGAHSVHWLELTLLEYAPCGHPSQRNIPPPPAVNVTLYPARHRHPLRVAPADESEYGGQPVHDPEYGRLYVFASHVLQLLAPVGENLPAAHHAHARYKLAPS